MFKIKGLSFVLVFFMALGFLNLAVAEAVNLTGNWQGSWTSIWYPPEGGSLTVNITQQSGTTLSGTLTITNTDCGNLYNLPLSGGFINDNTIWIDASVSCGGSYNTLEFTQGTIKNGGNLIEGVYYVSAYFDGSWHDWDYGEFSLERTIYIYTITASAGDGGTISPSGSVSVNAGSGQTFQFIPDAGYEVLDVTVDGSSVGSNTSYTFNSVSSNHTIAVSFRRAPQASPGIPLLLLDDE